MANGGGSKTEGCVAKADKSEVHMDYGWMEAGKTRERVDGLCPVTDTRGKRGKKRARDFHGNVEQ